MPMRMTAVLETSLPILDGLSATLTLPDYGRIAGNSETIRNGVVGTTRFTLSSDLKYSFLAA